MIPDGMESLPKIVDFAYCIHEAAAELLTARMLLQDRSHAEALERSEAWRVLAETLIVPVSE